MQNFGRSFVCLSALFLVACGDAKPAPEIAQEDVSKVAREVASKVESEVTNEASVEASLDTVMTSGKLSGLYKNAGEGAPIVLIIPGSGPTDLNGNNPMGVSANSYKLLAEGLEARGVSTVRVDKRGMFRSGDAGDPNAVTVDIYARDYSQWVESIRAETAADCVYILGHSEGALMASAAAVLNENVCGQILVSGVGRSFGQVLREQLSATPGSQLLMKNTFANLEKLERGDRVPVEDLDMVSKKIFPPQVQDFLISLMKTNPAEMAKTANIKTLIVHGETDIQTAVADAEALASATGGTLVIVPGVNHVLKEAPLNRVKNVRTYSQPDLPISSAVVDAIAAFVTP